MNMLLRVPLLSMMLLIMGCALFVSKETGYLLSAKNQATQEEVKQKFGQPVESKVTSTGDAVWVYHARDVQPSITSLRLGNGATNMRWCLIGRILRDWSVAPISMAERRCRPIAYRTG